MIVSFCKELTVADLTQFSKDYNCSQIPTMALLIDTKEKTCTHLSGNNPTTNADLNLNETSNVLEITYSGADQGYGLTVGVQCQGDSSNVFN